MAITSKDVAHVARLARLKLESAEVEQLASELSHILAHVEQLRAVDTSQIPPTRHVAVDRMPTRTDEPVQSLSHEEALSGAPKVLEAGFAVPVFVDD